MELSGRICCNAASCVQTAHHAEPYSLSTSHLHPMSTSHDLNSQFTDRKTDYFIFGFEIANGSRRGIYQVLRSLYKGMKEIDHNSVKFVFTDSNFTFDKKDQNYTKYPKLKKLSLKKVVGIMVRSLALVINVILPSSLDQSIASLITKSPWADRIRKMLEREVRLTHWVFCNSRIASCVAMQLMDLLPTNPKKKSWLICLSPTLVPRQRNYQLATFVHDLILLDFNVNDDKSILARLRGRLIFLQRLNCSCRNSDKIICVSHSTAKRLIQHNPSIKSKITVIHPSINELQLNNQRKSQPRHTSPICLCSIATIEPRKNFQGIFRALLDNHELPPIHLTCIGGRARANPDFHNRLKDLVCKLHNSSPHLVTFTGYVSAEEKFKYLQDSTAFIYVPCIEGAALPIIEAQLIGCPTLISDLPVFREFINAENAYFADPYNPASIGAELQKLCTDLKNGQCRPPMDAQLLAPLASPTRFAKDVMAALSAADLKSWNQHGAPSDPN